MSTPFVYRSRDPEVITAWGEATDEVITYVKATQAVLDDAGLGQYKCWRDSSGFQRGHFVGLNIPEGEKPPTGWRVTSRYAVPDKRLKAGKQIAAALATIKHPGDPLNKLIGMPPDVLHDSGWTTPAVRLLEDGKALYTAWRVDPAEHSDSFMRGKVEIDFGRWERVKLSEYYAEVERADAEKAAARDAA